MLICVFWRRPKILPGPGPQRSRNPHECHWTTRKVEPSLNFSRPERHLIILRSGAAGACSVAYVHLHDNKTATPTLPALSNRAAWWFVGVPRRHGLQALQSPLGLELHLGRSAAMVSLDIPFQPKRRKYCIHGALPRRRAGRKQTPGTPSLRKA